MTDGIIKLRLRRVQYEDPEGDEESLSDSKHHCVDSEIRLSGEVSIVNIHPRLKSGTYGAEAARIRNTLQA